MKLISQIFIVLMLIVSCSPNSSIEPILKININLNDKIDSNNPKDVKSKKGSYYSVNIDLDNNTDTIIDILTMSCTWQNNWISNDTGLYLLDETSCIHNSPTLIDIKPKHKTTFKGIIWVNDSLKTLKNKNLKLGFILIRKQDILNPFEFKNILNSKLKTKQEVIWSDPIW